MQGEKVAATTATDDRIFDNTRSLPEIQPHKMSLENLLDARNQTHTRLNAINREIQSRFRQAPKLRFNISL